MAITKRIPLSGQFDFFIYRRLWMTFRNERLSHKLAESLVDSVAPSETGSLGGVIEDWSIQLD